MAASRGIRAPAQDADPDVGGARPHVAAPDAIAPREAVDAAPRAAAAAPDAPAEPAASDVIWTALVESALEAEVERRFGRTLPAEKKRRLLGALARLREASLALQQGESGSGDETALRERLTRQVTILEVDAAFREELGIGVAQFVQGLDEGAVEDVQPLIERRADAERPDR